MLWQRCKNKFCVEVMLCAKRIWEVETSNLNIMLRVILRNVGSIQITKELLLESHIAHYKNIKLKTK